MKAAPREIVYVLDFGAQYGRLIARRVRDLGVYCEILPFDTDPERILKARPKALIFSGGPASVYEEEAPACAEALLASGIPVLGICYGHQLMTHLLGGTVSPGQTKEYGLAQLTANRVDGLFAGIDTSAALPCWMSHGDAVTAPPEGFDVLASTPTTPVAAMGRTEARLYGVQFHPEVSHTPFGMDLLKNFLFDVAECEGDWTMESIIEEKVGAIRQQVGEGRVVCAVSGGVDSTVVAALVHRAIGERLTCIFVDHGLLRKDEGVQVQETFRKHLEIPLVAVDASERFLGRLADVTDPEEKRKIIGGEFIAVFEEEAGKLGEVDYLAQGTLYPDVIESGSNVAATIKTHHNVGGLPERMNLQLVEPLRDLFKDEVRRAGLELGLPEEMIGRHPFPGPGLAVRLLGEITAEDVSTLQEADAIALEEIRAAGWYERTAQAFVVLAPIRSVGVVGDYRVYGKTAILRAVTTDDFMTADWARLPDDLLQRIASRIVNEVPGINRVVYDITQKPPATIEWE
ncbi:MAG: glutamine-hydrolyzing GMP synthase [Armatimonadia bacterium]|nr:glutamine-hydrolyzing GMP synthase [Armatimonadia bacterium]